MAIAGVWAPVVTPVTETFKPDHGAFVTHVRRVLDEGCHGVVLFGTTGDASSLSVADRIAAVDAVVAAGVDPARIVVGTGTSAVTEAIEITGSTMDAGCAGVLVVPPFYLKNPAAEGVARFYDEVIGRTGCDAVYLYNFPRLSMVTIEHDLVRRLIESHGPAIAGIKDSTGDPVSTSAYIDAFPDLAVLPGTESFFLDALRAGAAGVITAGANTNAAAIRTVWDAHQAGDDAAAETAQQAVSAYRAWLQQGATVPMLRSILASRDPVFATTVPPFVEDLPNPGPPPEVAS